jgi:putative transcriptional regulator
MKVCYDKLWKLLIDKKMKKTDLIREAKISSNVLAKMGKEESVSLESIGKICTMLGCNVDDILEFQSSEEITTDSGE